MRILIYKVSDKKTFYYTASSQEILINGAKYLAPALLIMDPSVSLAASDIDAKLEPLLLAIRKLAKPAAYGSMLWGWIRVSLGQKNEGYKQIKASIWGYLGIIFVPTIMNILDGIGGQS